MSIHPRAALSAEREGGVGEGAATVVRIGVGVDAATDTVVGEGGGGDAAELWATTAAADVSAFARPF